MAIPSDYIALVSESHDLLRRQLSQENQDNGLASDKAHYVAWGSTQQQNRHFEQLVKGAKPFLTENAKVLDFGCGQGDLFAYLTTSFPDQFMYLGVDILPEMIARAKLITTNEKVRFQQIEPIVPYDYFLEGETFDLVFASGVFSIMVDHTDILNFFTAFPSANYMVINLFAHGQHWLLHRKDEDFSLFSLYNPVRLQAYLQESHLSADYNFTVITVDKDSYLEKDSTLFQDGDTIVLSRTKR